jgi:hypothetical protein
MNDRSLPMSFGRLLVQAQRRFEAGQRGLQIAARQREQRVDRASAAVTLLRPRRLAPVQPLRWAA